MSSWPLDKDFLLTLGMAEELPVFWSTLHLCAECFTPGNSISDLVIVCSDCQCVRYCSEDCQNKHSAHHQEVCSKLAQIRFSEWDDLDLKGPELCVVLGDDQVHPTLPKIQSPPAEDEHTASSFTKKAEIDSEDDDALQHEHENLDAEHVMILTKQCLQNKIDPKELSEIMERPPHTVEEAQELLESIASAGNNRDAQFGMVLLSTKAQKEDDALKWTRLAAQNGLADAQVRYAMSYWFEGRHDHKVDFVQAILWLRRALAQGNQGLSPRSFTEATNTARMMATQYYNTINQLEMKQRGVGFQREMKLVAECGIIPAINMVWLVHSKGDWYENFFASVEQEKDVAT